MFCRIIPVGWVGCSRHGSCGRVGETSHLVAACFSRAIDYIPFGKLEQPMHEKRTILLIDDDHTIRALLAHSLERAGFNILEAANGEVGIEITRSRQPDLVLLDLNMPGMDGYQFLRLFHEGGGNIPVIILTANDFNVDEIVEILALDPSDFVTKTVSPLELVARIQWVLRRHTDRRQDA